MRKVCNGLTLLSLANLLNQRPPGCSLLAAQIPWNVSNPLCGSLDALPHGCLHFLVFDCYWAGWTPLGYALRKTIAAGRWTSVPRAFEMVELLVLHVDVDAPLNRGHAEGCDGHLEGEHGISYRQYAEAIQCEPRIIRLLTLRQERRRSCRAAAITLLGLRLRQGRTLLHSQPVDVVRIVVRKLWASRRAAGWDLAWESTQREKAK
jgi:hypothetical protein